MTYTGTKASQGQGLAQIKLRSVFKQSVPSGGRESQPRGRAHEAVRVLNASHF